ncbi:MAG: hemerythrin family protein [Betaproteobacteria bacterium]
MVLDKMCLQSQIDSKLLIGVPSIDNEHFKLVCLLDRLIETTQPITDSANFFDVLNQLGSEMKAHFVNEESYLMAFHMPEEDISTHVTAHTTILDQYTRLNADLLEGKVPDANSLLAMFKEWVIGHILNHDLKIRYYLPSNCSGVI